LFQNQSTINGVKTQPSVAYGFEQQQNTFNRAFGPLKISGYTLAPSGSSTGSLIVGSGTAYAPGANYTIDPNEPYYVVDSGTNISKIFRYYQSGSSWVYLTNAGAGYTTIDPGQYSNNGVLATVQPNDWSIQRVFWFPNSVAKAIVVYYGNQSYSTEADAIANVQFESFVEAPNTAANAIYLGAIIINQNGVFTSPNTFTTLYTVPAANSAIISTLNICNVSASNVTFRAAIRPAGTTLTTAHYIAYDVALPAQDAIGLTLGITLAATDVVTVHSLQGNVAQLYEHQLLLCCDKSHRDNTRWDSFHLCIHQSDRTPVHY
jgi:hypothetical protein